MYVAKGTLKIALARFVGIGVLTGSQGLAVRIERALWQPMYLISDTALPPSVGIGRFVVQGSTGNAYTVEISTHPSCTCPDFMENVRASAHRCVKRSHDHVADCQCNYCKHIIFVLIKVLGLSSSSSLIGRGALNQEQLQVIRQHAGLHSGMRREVLASAGVRRAHSAAAGLPRAEGSAQGRTCACQCAAHGAQFRAAAVPQRVLSSDAECPICFDHMSQSDDLAWCRQSCGQSL